MIQSMTGFASAKGSFQAFSWTWELRSVNGKGLDLRLRVPEWIDGLEAALRARLGKALTRGNVTLSLRLLRDEEAGTLALNEGQLASVLTAMARVEAEAMDRGLSLAPANATDILALRGVLETAAPNDDVAPLAAALIKDFEPLLQAFLEMRRSEGTALSRVMAAQLDDIDRLTASAATAAEARKGEMADNLRTALARVLDNIDGADPQRVAQELAMIAVKSDVTEEIDRLTAHVAAARELLTNGAPMGRKLDFLAQEFNREANTLCSKAQSKDLTRIGLDLKAVIDQMREQVQNVE